MLETCLPPGSLKEKVMKVDSVYTVMACAVPMVRWVMRILMTERSMALLLDKKTGRERQTAQMMVR